MSTEEKRCPLCGGGENQCGVAKGEKECWCMTVSIPEHLLKTVQRKPNICICSTCIDTYKKEQV